MKHHLVSRISIWILAIVMIVFGIQHFKHPKDMLVSVPAFLPGGIIWVYVVGAAFILAGVSFIINRYVSVAGYLLAILLFSFVVMVHWPNYKNSGDAEMRRLAMVNMLKDLALSAFALYVGVNAKHQRLNTDE